MNDTIRGPKVLAAANNVEYITEVLSDYFLVRSGIRTLGEADPQVKRILESEPSALDVAGTLARELGLPKVNSRAEAIQFAMSSSEFAKILSTASQISARARLTDSLADLNALTKQVPVPSFSASPMPELETQMIDDKRQEGVQIEALVLRGSRDTVTCYLRTVAFAATRDLIVNDSAQLIPAAMQSVSDMAARRACKEYAALLESNPTLADGLPLFGADTGNDLATTELSATSVSLAMSALRNLPDSGGEKSNIPSSVLLTPGNSEATARVLIAALDLQDIPVRLKAIALPWLAPGSAYLLGSPDRYPTIAQSRWEGNGRQFLSIDPVGSVDWREFAADAIALRISIVYGLDIVGRAAVRFGISA